MGEYYPGLLDEEKNVLRKNKKKGKKSVHLDFWGVGETLGIHD